MKKSQFRGKKRSLKQKCTHVFIVLSIIAIGQGVLRGMFATHTVTFYASQDPLVDTYSAPDPCGLTAVRCAGEEDTEDPIIALIHSEFGEHAPTAIAIAKAESGLHADAESWTDKTQDGHPFSIGLFQVNITVTGVNGLDCPKAFTGKNYTARIINEDLYNQCVQAAKNPFISTKIAKNKFDGGGWGHWGVYKNKSYLKFL